MRHLLATVLLFVCLNGMASAQAPRQRAPANGMAATSSNNQQHLSYYFRAVCKYGGMPYTYPSGQLFYCTKFHPCPQLHRYKCQDLYTDSYGVCCPNFGDISDAYKQQIMYNLMNPQPANHGSRRVGGSSMNNGPMMRSFQSLMGGANTNVDPMMRGFQSLMGGLNGMMFNEEMPPARRLA